MSPETSTEEWKALYAKIQKDFEESGRVDLKNAHRLTKLSQDLKRVLLK